MPLANLNMVDHFLHVRLTHNLEPRNNERHLEVRNALLCLFNALVDNFEFFKQTHRLPIIVENDAANVAQLNHEHVLLDAGVNCGLQQSAEELVVFAEFSVTRKLVLK